MVLPCFHARGNALFDSTSGNSFYVFTDARVEKVLNQFSIRYFVRFLLQPFRHMRRLYLHFAGLGFEAIGAFFIWLETLRLNSRVPAGGMTFADRPQYGHWPYHQGTLGFGILLVGFLIAAFSIWLDHRAIHRNPSQISQ
jgi:sterol desaturase/sphingolipid hydroxylase (fatty acid hydroxylase superfamily)